MVNVAVIALPLCSYLFTCVHMASVNTTEGSATEDSPTVARLRTSGSDYWTEWYNVDDPYSGSGDFETLDSVTSALGRSICPSTHKIAKADCRIDNGDNNGDNQKDILNRPCSVDGVICRNRDQLSRMCNNYNIRFYCVLKEDGVTNEDSTRSPPRFDMRIYIILAAVPVAIFILRICWSFTFERRRRRLRQALRERRRTQNESESFDPGLFMPPPSYQDLFGDGQVPFALSRQYSLCGKCKSSQCIIFRNRSRTSETQNSQSSESESPQNSSEVVDMGDPSPENITTTAESPRSNRSESQSSSSDLSSSEETESTSASTNPQNCNEQVNSQPVDASRCDCPCHKRAPEVMSYDNPAFSPEVEIQEGRSPRLPGMHLSVFSLFRSPSESSITEPPPPTYKEALKILKKSQGKH